MKRTLVLALLAATAVSRAETFTVLIFEPVAKIAARPHAPAYWRRYGDYFGSLQKAGLMRGGTALYGDARAVRVGAGLPRGRLQLGGYFTLEAKDAATARAWAAKCPAVRDGGAVEIRPNYPNPAMKEIRK